MKKSLSVIIWLAIALVNATQNVVGLRGEGVKRPLALFFLNTALGWMLWAADDLDRFVTGCDRRGGCNAQRFATHG